MKQLFALGLLAFHLTAAAQWQLVTPIKNTSEYADLVLVNDLVGYAADRPTGTILRTADGGATWERRQHLLLNAPLAIHMWDEERGIAVGGSGVVYRTTDGFRNITTTLNTTFGHLNCVFFLNDTLGWVGTQSGRIYRSTNGGADWTLMASGQGTSNYITAIQFVDTAIGYASCYGGGKVLKSMDGGLTWQSIAPEELVFIRDLHFSNALTGVAVGHAGHVIRTTDGGATWSFMPSNTTYNLVSLSVQGDNMVACGWWGHVVHSTNGGLTWTEQVFGPEHMSVATTPSGFGLMGSAGRIYRTTDHGATWSLFHEGTSSGSINKVSFANNTIGVAGNGLRTTDGGRSWVSAPSGGLGVHLRADGTGCRGGGSGSFGRTTDFFATGIAGIGPNMAIRCTWSLGEATHLVGGGAVNGGIYRTTDNGINWTRVLDVGNITINDLWFVNGLQGYAVGEYGDNYRTVDGGLTWQDMPGTSGSHTIFFVDDRHGWTKYHRTTDGGDTWTMMGGTPQSTMSIFFTNVDTGYAVASSGQVVRSLDGGITWANLLPEIANAAINDAAYVDGYIVIAGGLGDIHRAQVACPGTAAVPTITAGNGLLCTTTIGTVQWYWNGGPLAEGDTPCIAASAAGTYHVIVTDAFGCTSAPSAPYEVVNTGIAAGAGTGATRLAPNPAVDLVRIERLDASPASLTLTDMQGRLVDVRRINGNTTTLDVSGLRPGVYLVCVASQDRVETLRLVKD